MTAYYTYFDISNNRIGLAKRKKSKLTFDIESEITEELNFSEEWFLSKKLCRVSLFLIKKII